MSAHSQPIAERTMSKRNFLEFWTAAVQRYQTNNRRPVPTELANINGLGQLLVYIGQRRDKLLKAADKNKLPRSVKKVLHGLLNFMKQVAAVQPPLGAILSEALDLSTDEKEIPNMFDTLTRSLERLAPCLDTRTFQEFFENVFVHLLVLLDIKERTTIASLRHMKSTLGELKHLLSEETLMMNTKILEQQANMTDLLRNIDDFVLRWLSAPDVSSSHDDAVNKRHGNSGDWFMSSREYNEWKTKDNTFMWISGKAGSGKTVLCASIIKDLDQSNNALAYFYFDTNKQEQGSLIQLLTSLVLSLYQICGDQGCFQNVDWNHRPKFQSLNQVLQNMLQSSERSVYLVIDALDECQEADLGGVLGFIKTIRQLNSPNCHILVTSKEKDEIKISFQEISPIINVDLFDMAHLINNDIKSYIEYELQHNRQLQRWGDEGKDLILTTLTEKADGMFRLAACHLSGLKKCFSSMQGLNEELVSLPKTLQDSYQKTMDGIPEMNKLTVDKLLMWLACSFSPLSLPELATVVEFDDITYEPKDGLKLHNAQDIARFCSDLVHVRTDDKVIVAHESVKMFLLLHHYKLGGAKLCHAHIAKICIQSAIFGIKPLESYSKLYWASHIIQGGLMDDDTIIEMSKPLFMELHEKFASYKFLDNDYYYYFTPADGHPSSPLVYASLLGMSKTVDWLLNQINSPNDLDLALHAASYQGNGIIIDSLIKRGARVDATHDLDKTTALQFASIKPHVEVVRLLIKNSANVNQEGYQGGTILHYLAMYGHVNLVEELLSRIDIMPIIDAFDDVGCTPLHRASVHGHLAVMKTLLAKGANINEHGTKGTALHFASFFGHLDVVKFLLDHNAQVDARNPATGTPLHAACFQGHLDAVKLLLQSGADVTLPGGQAGSALQAALHKKHDEIVTLLLQHNAMPNAQSRMQDPDTLQKLLTVLRDSGLGDPEVDEFGEISDLDLYLVDKDVADRVLGEFEVELKKHTFEAGVGVAARNGNMERLKHFLQLKEKYAPDIDAALSLGWALCSAASYGQLEMMNYLLQQHSSGFKDFHFVCALSDAILRRRNESVELLLKEVAFDPATFNNGPGLVRYAAHWGNEYALRSLLEHGADVNALTPGGRSALGDALRAGKPNIARILIEEWDANIHLTGTESENGPMIGIAAQQGYLDIVELMMKKGVDKNEYVTALGQGCNGKHVDVVQYLMSDENMLKQLALDDLQAILNTAGNNRDHEITLMLEEKINENMACAEKDEPEHEEDGKEEQAGEA